MKIKARPQKKVLSLVLCLAVMLSVMVVGAGAAFSDQDKIENTEAVDACSTLNIIKGYEDGAFHPERNIKRAEVAKMICVALNSGKDPNVSTNAVPTFTDVRGTIYEWAEGYIESCVAQGIVDGVGGTRFAPAGNVTAAQLAKMLLVGLGYNAKTENFVGNTWETNVNYRASQKGLYNGLEKMDTSAPVTRDQAAQMVWNAMQAYVVEYKDGVVQDKVVGGTMDKITLLRDRYNALISVGTLTTIDKAELGISMNDTDKLASDDPYVRSFSKLDKDYSGLMGQKVKVIYNRNHSDQVLGVFSTSDNTVYSVIANETSKDDNKVKFGGKSYSVDGDLKTFINGKEDLTTSLKELDNNTLNPNAYTFVDSDANGRLDTLVVKTYDVAQVTYVASDKIIAGGQTYKYADENIADGIKKDDWVVITHNLYKDNLDIVKAEMQTGTLNGTRLDRDVTPYFDGAEGLGKADTYNEYQIGDTWFNGGEKLVQSKASENDLHVVRPGEKVEYIAVNGVMFYVKKASGDAVGRVADVAMVIERDDTSVRDEVKIAFFDGTTKTVTVNDKSKVPFDGEDKLTVGTVYEYDVTNGEYRFETLKDGVAEEKYENYYGDLTWRGKDKALAAKTFDNLVIDDNAQVLLYKDNKVKAISGKQFKAGNVFGRVVEGKAVYGFSGDMNGLDRIGALAVEVNNLENIVKTWSNYGYIVTQPIKTGNNKIEYTIWTKDGNITVQEDKNNITERDKGTVIGFDTLTELPSTPSGDNKVTHLIDDVEKLDADEITFTAVVDSNDKSVKFSAKPVYADGAELDVAGTILYIDSDEDDMEIGVKDGSIKDAQKINGKWQANALVIGNNGDIELLIVDQGSYLKNDIYKNYVKGDDTTYGGEGATKPEETDKAIDAASVSMPALTVGEALPDATTTTANVKASTKWDTTGDVEAGKTYTATVTLTAADGYKFTKDTKVTAGENGKVTAPTADTKTITVTYTIKVEGSGTGEGNVTGAIPGITKVTAATAPDTLPTVDLNYNEKDNGTKGSAQYNAWVIGQLKNNADFKALVSDTPDRIDGTSILNGELKKIATLGTETEVFKVSLNGTTVGYAAGGAMELTGYTAPEGSVLLNGKAPAGSGSVQAVNTNMITGKTEVSSVTADLDLWTAYTLNLGTSGNAVSVTAYQVEGGEKVTSSSVTTGQYVVPGTQIWVKISGTAGEQVNLSVNGTVVTTAPLTVATSDVEYTSPITLSAVDTTSKKYEISASEVVKLNIDGKDYGYVAFNGTDTLTLPASAANAVLDRNFVQLTASSAAAGTAITGSINECKIDVSAVDPAEAIGGVIYLKEAVEIDFSNSDVQSALSSTAAVTAKYNGANADSIDGSNLSGSYYFAVGTTIAINGAAPSDGNSNGKVFTLTKDGAAVAETPDEKAVASNYDSSNPVAAKTVYTIKDATKLVVKFAK